MDGNNKNDFISVVADPPGNLKAISFNPFTMHLTWSPPAQIATVANISGYYVFYREYNSPPGAWKTAGVPSLNSSSFNLTDLKAYTKYRFRMTLAVTRGNGPASDETIQSTIEGGKQCIIFSCEPMNKGRFCNNSQIYTLI